MSIFKLLLLPILWLLETDSDMKRIGKMDNNPYCSVKSDEWYKNNKKEWIIWDYLIELIRIM
jgi:hypothetical protein